MRWCLLVCLTACYSPRAIDAHCAPCTGVADCPGDDRCIDNVCQRAAGQCAGEDAGTEPITTADARACWGIDQEPFFEICPPADVMPRAVTSINTMSNTACSFVMPMDAARGRPELCVIVTNDTMVNSVIRFAGPRPIVVVVRGELVIAQLGTLDVAGRRDDLVTTAVAAGSNVIACQGVAGPGSGGTDSGGGGPGGSFGARGGDGGGRNSDNMLAIAKQAIPNPTFRGGCAGGLGGDNRFGSGGTLNGNSGGAIYILASSLRVDGTINANGGGGRASVPLAVGTGGSGGGSGGMILLWSPTTMQLGANARIMALGGGGANGGDGGGGIGDDPDAPQSPATKTPTGGGPGSGGGGTQGQGEAGVQAPNLDVGGGGGAGGVGYIKIIPSQSGPQIAPIPN